MKSPEEIKKGLECCFPSEDPDCFECPYEATERCFDARINDILAYIQQLERERDAAVEALKQFSCASCIHEEKMVYESPCDNCSKNYAFDHVIGDVEADNWQWRGAQEVE